MDAGISRGALPQGCCPGWEDAGHPGREGEGALPAPLPLCKGLQSASSPHAPLQQFSGGIPPCTPKRRVGHLSSPCSWASPWDVPPLLATGDGFGVLVVAGHTGGPISKDLGVVTWLPLSTTCAPFFVSLFIYNLVWLFFFFLLLLLFLLSHEVVEEKKILGQMCQAN